MRVAGADGVGQLFDLVGEVGVGVHDAAEAELLDFVGLEPADDLAQGVAGECGWGPVTRWEKKGLG